jgi:hypothetical protein
LSIEEITQTYGPFPKEAIPELMKVASELLDSEHVLLDANMPMQLVVLLNDPGIEGRFSRGSRVGHAQQWQLGKRGGAGEITALLTRDRLFGESAAGALRVYPEFCVVQVALPRLYSSRK